MDSGRLSDSSVALMSDTAIASTRSRAQSMSSDESDSSHRTAVTKNTSPYIPRRPFYTQASTGSLASIQSFSRPLQRLPNEQLQLRQHATSPTEWVPGHRARQRSQGFFDPTVSSAISTDINNMNGLTASQSAAQAAMHAQDNQHNRKRSQTLPDPSAPMAAPPPRRPPPVQATSYVQTNPYTAGRGYDGFPAAHSMAAASAANAAFPRSPQYSPQMPPDRIPPPVPDREVNVKPSKEKSKMKLFSKPKNIGLSKDDKKHPPLPSPNRLGNYSSSTLNRITNASTTSLIDPGAPSNTSLYSSANASTSTLVPLDREREKEKHKHHFLSRQKNKLKDKDDLHLQLSSASSTSKPTDPSAPQPLYNFTVPPSPGHASSFAKSVSGLDLRHGGRALREKKKEDRLVPTISNTSLLEPLPRESFSSQNPDLLGPPSFASTGIFGPPTTATALAQTPDLGLTQAGIAGLGAPFGLTGITADDAWPLLKARLLHIFEGEDPRPPIEDFNALVTVHLKRCIQRRAPTLVIEDLNELLQTGFSSLDQTLRQIPADRLVPHLVAMWNLIFSVILPFLQAVFLPLDLEFKGRGSIMTAREAADFWGAALPSDIDATDPDANQNIFVLGEELDVRRIIILKFRDTVILPRHDALMTIFTRLSLDSISAGISLFDPLPEPPSIGSSTRPGTAHSTDGGPSSFHAMNSYNSQSSTHLESASPFSAIGRSRATSNTSAGSFPSSVGAHSASSLGQQYMPPQPMDSAQVTDMVGRMLQCVSVLASVQSKDDAQNKMERLTKELKLNWLGRGRTGRQRRGFVGTRLRPTPALA